MMKFNLESLVILIFVIIYNGRFLWYINIIDSGYLGHCTIGTKCQEQNRKI